MGKYKSVCIQLFDNVLRASEILLYHLEAIVHKHATYITFLPLNYKGLNGSVVMQCNTFLFSRH